MSVPNRLHGKWRLLACAVCTGTVLAMSLSGFGPWLELVETPGRDLLVRFGRRAPLDRRIVFLAIDQQSVTLDPVLPAEIAASPILRRMRDAGWPWPRDVYPAIIDRLAAAGARVIALDLLFPTPRAGDDLFQAALERHRNRVVIGCNFSEATRAQGGFRTLQWPAPTLIPPAAGGDARVGFVNFWPDPDGRVRRARFHASLAEPNRGAGDEDVQHSLVARMLEQAGLAAAVPPGHTARIPRFAQRITARSLYEILVDRLWNSPPLLGGAFFKDKLVLIGPEGNWSKDQVETALGRVPGPELHLHVLNAALTGEFVREPSQTAHAALIVAGGLVAWLLGRAVSSPLWRLGAFLGLGGAAFLGALLAYNHFPDGTGRLTFWVGPVVAMLGSGVVWLAWEQVFERLERLRTRRTLERYVSRDLVHEILDNPDSYFTALGGMRRTIAVLFTDLRGFTTLTEQCDSHQLVQQLNEYFSEMVRIVFENGGTLDKFIGDAVMAVWGNIRSAGPVEDVSRCVTAALQMRRELAGLNTRWRARGLPTLALGAGINYGEAIVGNIGSADRRHEKMELTAIGDVVNLASRLEGVTKEYGVDLVLGADAAQQVRDRFPLVLVDCVQVKGRAAPLDIFTVLDPADDRPVSGGTDAWLHLHHEAMAACRRRDFAGALRLFEQSASASPLPALTNLHLARCREYLAHPPGPDWNGVHVMTHK